jgi:adenosylcobyric acid synthase
MENRTIRSPSARTLAVLGTGSDVGKSVIATALCRILADMGLRVAPFKAQNMSNNSGVTPEGLEMGRAQIVQAEAARVPPHVDMNPILLKPTSDVGSQVVLLGKAVTNSTAGAYHSEKGRYWSHICKAFQRLSQNHDVIILEGAGSCAEVNLMAHDLVNFKMAAHAKAPVILAGDIHRGGIFAQLIGTLACLPSDMAAVVSGFIINRFRGDISLFEDGIKWIERKTGKPVFGVLPWYDHFRIEAEDSVIIEQPKAVAAHAGDRPAIAVLRIPHISNFTDFDPLLNLAGVDLFFIEQAQSLDGFQALIIPGSKNTRADLEWVHRQGWHKEMRSFAASGRHLLGICGGYQMLGDWVDDPTGIEGHPGRTEGLGLLPVETTLEEPKTTTLTQFKWHDLQGGGYEIHMGRTVRTGGSPLFDITKRNGPGGDATDGCMSDDGHIIGTYMHGMFDSPAITRRWLDTIGLSEVSVDAQQGLWERDHAYDALAAHFRKHIDTAKLLQLIEQNDNP